MKGAVYGTIFIESIKSGAKQTADLPGGDAYFAYQAIVECGGQAKVISGVSRELLETGLEWLEEPARSNSDLLLRTDLGIRNVIEEDGTVSSSYGNTFTKYNTFLHRLFIEQLEPYVQDIDYLYLSDMLDHTAAEKLSYLKERNKFRVMWQIPQVNNDSERQLVFDSIPVADAIALSAEDAFMFLKTDTESKVFDYISSTGKKAYYLDKEGRSWILSGIRKNCIQRNDMLCSHKESERRNYEAACAAALICSCMNGKSDDDALTASVSAADKVLRNRRFPLRTEFSMESTTAPVNKQQVSNW